MESIMALDLKDIDGRILDELAAGRNVPSNLAEELDSSRQWIQQRLKMLEAAGHVENIGRGVYELVDDPREDIDVAEGREPPAESEENIQDLRNRLDQLESEAAELRDENDRLRDWLDTAEDLDVERIRSAVDAALVALEGQHPNIDAAQTELEGIMEVLPDE